MTPPVDEGFPDEWQEAIRRWADRTPLVTAVYLFGSRAKGTASAGSDIDLAFETKADGPESAYTVAFFNTDQWREELQALLPKPVHLQYADRGEDKIVWPAVQNHGIKII
jgi:predicted nucleotidyltransferase